MSDSIKVLSISPIDWPSSQSELPKAKIQCGTISYHFYNARKNDKIPIDYMSQYRQNVDDDGNDSSLSDLNGVSNLGKKGGGDAKKKKEIDLKTLTPNQLDKLSYYQILGNIQMHSTQEQIKRAFHKACLKYHPDKEDSASNAKISSNGGTDGTGENHSSNHRRKGEDPVFLKVKEAFETLSDPKLRKSYDSTVDFDDRIPSGSDVRTERDFYMVFGSCFDRNLRFAAENEPGISNNNNNSSGSLSTLNKNGKKKKKKNDKNSSSNDTTTKLGPPSIGNPNTPIDEVHRFYDYWVRFESWRDFTLPATKELEHDTDMAECRFEKRWMEKEIARKAKAMKRDEMARITRLVDRAMSLDPRLQREKERIEDEKKEKQRLKKEQKEREEQERREKEEREEKERLEREEKEKEERAKMKVLKEQGKKVLRKAKQLLRKTVVTGYEAESSTDSKTWDKFEDMNDDLEFLCSWLSAEELRQLTEEIATTETNINLTIVKEAAKEHRIASANQSKEEIEKREALRQQAAEKEAAKKAKKAPKEWSKEELSTLAKAVKKYPSGGANRWDAIALYINNLLKLADPRSKEECIEKYNAIASGALNPTAAAVNKSSTDSEPKLVQEASAWSEEQDKQLQEGLSKFPSSMDKNERWTAIANCVAGKSKKECVQRFKAIREALKKK